eukprot:m.92922 g.92922  ORF g.92922 m.92922 type:complete len:357 (+) comp12089_c2_seq1:168-1238(+)
MASPRARDTCPHEQCVELQLGRIMADQWSTASRLELRQHPLPRRGVQPPKLLPDPAETLGLVLKRWLPPLHTSTVEAAGKRRVSPSEMGVVSEEERGVEAANVSQDRGEGWRYRAPCRCPPCPFVHHGQPRQIDGCVVPRTHPGCSRSSEVGGASIQRNHWVQLPQHREIASRRSVAQQKAVPCSEVLLKLVEKLHVKALNHGGCVGVGPHNREAVDLPGPHRRRHPLNRLGCRIWPECVLQCNALAGRGVIEGPSVVVHGFGEPLVGKVLEQVGQERLTRVGWDRRPPPGQAPRLERPQQKGGIVLRRTVGPEELWEEGRAGRVGGPAGLWPARQHKPVRDPAVPEVEEHFVGVR